MSDIYRPFSYSLKRRKLNSFYDLFKDRALHVNVIEYMSTVERCV